MGIPLQNDLYLRALARETTSRTPVWVMRQAGRYLPEYLKVRKQAGNFMTLCSTPELACEVTLQPIDRFNLDAAILFSDILTIPDAMGLGLHFETGEGPKFSNPVRTRADVEALPIPDPGDKLRYVTDAVSLIRKELNGRVPLIGFSGSPWTLATYMIEGGGTKDFAKIKGMLFSDPASLHELLDRTAQSVILYLNAQVEAGAQSLMIFDTWGGVLSPNNYKTFSLQYMQQIRTRTGDRVALQGNLDPSVLYGSTDTIETEVQRVLDSYGPGPGHVFNLGHGIHQFVNPEHLGIMVEAVRKRSQR